MKILMSSQAYIKLLPSNNARYKLTYASISHIRHKALNYYYSRQAHNPSFAPHARLALHNPKPEAAGFDLIERVASRAVQLPESLRSAFESEMPPWCNLIQHHAFNSGRRQLHGSDRSRAALDLSELTSEQPLKAILIHDVLFRKDTERND